MYFDRQLYCAFVDHSVVPVTELGRLLQALPEKAESARDEARLATCQRLEIYTCSETFALPTKPFGSLSSHVKIVSGRKNIVRRLAGIMAGAESLLLGERFAPQQVQRAFSGCDADSALGQAVSHACEIALKVRDSFNFYASKDYGDITYDLLDQTACSRGQADTVVVVGSGMLGRALALHSACARYASVYAVSRWPKQLRSKLSSSSVKCLPPEQLAAAVSSTRFDLIAAVSNVIPDYAGWLASCVTQENCRSVVDLSTVPIMQSDRPENYIHEYDEKFICGLKLQNHALINVLPSVNETLDVLSLKKEGVC